MSIHASTSRCSKFVISVSLVPKFKNPEDIQVMLLFLFPSFGSSLTMETYLIVNQVERMRLDSSAHADIALNKPSVQEAKISSPRSGYQEMHHSRSIVEVYLKKQVPEFQEVIDLRES